MLGRRARGVGEEVHGSAGAAGPREDESRPRSLPQVEVKARMGQLQRPGQAIASDSEKCWAGRGFPGL